MEPIIAVEQLVKRYRRGSRNAVDGLSFEVLPGELFALLGPNGAGKTTTLSILTTTLAATSGKVRITGYDPARQASEVRARVGNIFQNQSLDVNLTAEENIRLHAILYGLYPFRPTYRTMPAPYRDDVMRLAGILGLKDELFQPIRTYSGGMRRKLEIIRSLMHQPSVLFLDEPTAGLDPQSRKALWKHLIEVRRQSGTTFCLTTHYLEEAEQADRVCIINKGRVVAYGTPDEIKAQLVSEYLLIDADDRARLRAELQSRGIAFTETPQFKIGLHGQNAHPILKAIETPLTVVRTHLPTLEDAYLAITAEEENGNDA